MSPPHASLAAKLAFALVVLLSAVLIVGWDFTLQRSAAPLALETATSIAALTAARPTAPVPPASAPVSTSPGAQSTPDWKLYPDERHGFELLYPLDSVVAATSEQTRIALPINPGTNLQEKYLLIDVQQGDASCRSPLAVGYSPEALQVSQVEIGVLTFTQLSGSEGAAGNFYDARKCC